MQNRRSTDKIKGWTRLAASLGVLLSQPGVRAKIGELLQDRMKSGTTRVGETYEDAAHRVGAAADALRGRGDRTEWPTRAMIFVAGLGVGAGIAIVLAPTSGRETRSAIRNRAVNFKDTVVESASTMIGRTTKSAA
jgi:hypothetical protein